MSPSCSACCSRLLQTAAGEAGRIRCVGAIRTLAAGRTVLLISHRFSSVRTADRILVLERGRLTESGTHRDLVRAGGHYAELFRLQARAYLDGAPTPKGEVGPNREE